MLERGRRRWYAARHSEQQCRHPALWLARSWRRSATGALATCMVAGQANLRHVVWQRWWRDRRARSITFGLTRLVATCMATGEQRPGVIAGPAG